MDGTKYVRFFTPELRIHAGDGAIAALGAEIDRLGAKRAIVITGRSLAADKALLAELNTASGGRIAGVWSGVRPHSPAQTVRDAAREMRAQAADVVIALGGGSAIVTARAASIYLAEGGEGRDLNALATGRDPLGQLQSPRLAAPKLAQIVIPTTPTTAYPKVGSAVLGDDGAHRWALFDPKTRAKAVLLEPRLLTAAPRYVVVASAWNTLAMAVEGLLTGLGNPASDAYLWHALRRTLAALESPDTFDSAETRLDLAWAAGLCGLGTDSAGGGVSLAVGHAVGMFAHASNGAINAICMPKVLAWYGDLLGERLAPVLAQLGGDASYPDPTMRLEKRFHALRSISGVPHNLRSLGVEKGQLAAVATASMLDWVMTQAARKPRSEKDVQNILEACY